MERLVVDGMNVIGSRPDGWWRDRPGAARRLVGRLARLAATGPEVTVVFDGAPVSGVDEGSLRGVEVRYATRGGRDAADDRIVELVGRDRDPAGLVVVTSDAALAERVRAVGAQCVGAGHLLTRLDGLGE